MPLPPSSTASRAISCDEPCAASHPPRWMERCSKSPWSSTSPSRSDAPTASPAGSNSARAQRWSGLTSCHRTSPSSRSWRSTLISRRDSTSRSSLFQRARSSKDAASRHGPVPHRRRQVRYLPLRSAISRRTSRSRTSMDARFDSPPCAARCSSSISGQPGAAPAGRRCRFSTSCIASTRPRPRRRTPWCSWRSTRASRMLRTRGATSETRDME